MKIWVKIFILTLALVANNYAKEDLVAGKESKVVSKDTIVCLETNQGTIEIKLFPSMAPKACENFITLVKKNYYNGITFHRVIKDFMLQTGDPTGTGRGGNSCWNKPFEDEVKIDLTFNKVGLVAMANSGPNSNGSQFFITTAKTPWLNMHHTIFGEVISGYDVVKKIEAVKTGVMDKPLEVQKIIKAYVKEEVSSKA
jgi:peptidylprolyl isomerase